MSVSFIPAVAESLHLTVPGWHATAGSSTVQLCFYAFLDHEQYHQFKHHGMRVQLWSNMPNGERKEGEWGEMDFTENPSNTGGELLSLVPLNYTQDQQGKHVLSLVISFPFSGLSSKLFNFTYRFLYSSGEERWLGTFGRDGKLSFDIDSNGGSSLVLEEGWTESSNALLWDTRGRLVEDLRTAQFIRPDDWAIWPIGKNSFLGKFMNSSLVFLVPRVRPHSILCPRTVVLSASPDASLSLTSSGEIQLSGSGSLLLQTCDPFGSVESLIVRALAHCSVANCQYFNASDHIVLARSSTVSPVQAMVIPFGPSVHWLSRIQIDSVAFTDILGTKTSQCVIFSPANSGVHLLDTENVGRAAILISAPSFGGQFVVSPLYTIPKNDTDPGTELRLSLLSPHSVSAQGVADDILPTPPPSPQLRPIAHLSPHPSSLNDSSQSISDMGIPSRRDSPELVISTHDDSSEASSVLTVRPGLSGQRSSASLVGSYRENSSYIVLAFMKHIYLVVALWLSLVFHKCFGGLGNNSRDDPERSQPPSPQSEAGEDADTDPFSPVDERTPLLSRNSANSPTIQQPKISPVVQGSNGANPTLVLETAESPPTQVPAGLVFDLFDSITNHSMIVYDISGTISSEHFAEQIAIDVNGKPVELTNVRKINDKVLLLEIAWMPPGKLCVRYRA